MVEPSGYPIPAAEARAEIEVLRSRFVATLAPAPTVEEARALIARVRREFADATHHVPAYVVGHGSSVVAHCHDDGEPSGTAGRPALAVLQGSGLGDVAVVVTRYYGGTKLGTGGLVRAYGDAVRAVLEVATVGRKVPIHVVRLALPYALYEHARQTVEAHGGTIHEAEFGAQVTLTAAVGTDAIELFQRALQELSAGSVRAEILETRAVAQP